MKKCAKCKDVKNYSCFPKHSTQKDGFSVWCRECSNKAANRYYHNKRDLVNKRRKEIYKNNPEKFKNISRINSWKKMNINITIEEYNILFSKQDGKCAICFTDQRSLKRSLSVDHCHTTGRIRGLLCSVCNRSIGNFHDNVGTLQSAINYLNMAKGIYA